MSTEVLQRTNLEALFAPKSIAVIGASRRKDSVGYAILHNLIKEPFKGSVYPINPKADEIEGLACFNSVLEITEHVDLAVIILPSHRVLSVVEQCVEKSVKAVIIISAGFREVGPEGRALEDEIVKTLRAAEIPLLGPNCLGLINAASDVRMNASFSRVTPRAGNIAFISQSGALCTSVLDYAKERKIGFSKFISVGNKADLAVVDLLEYLKDDPQSDVILLYVEDIEDAQGFIRVCREIKEKKKPILVIKSGRTEQGAKAASSHTGSLMGSDETYDALFRQAGVLRLSSIAEILQHAIAFAYQSLPYQNRVAILTNAGGPGIMATDACVGYGLSMAKPSEQSIALFKEVLPATANFHNPIDVIGDAREDRYEKVLEQLLIDDCVDSILVLLTPQAMTNIADIAKSIVKVCKDSSKTVLASFMGGADVEEGVKILEDACIPHYDFPEDAAKTLQGMVDYRELLSKKYQPLAKPEFAQKKAEQIIDTGISLGQSFLTVDQSMEVFRSYDLPLLECGLAKTSKEALEISKRAGFPLALKIVSDDILHKFDFGGVALNISNEEELKAAFEGMLANIRKKLPDAKIDGVFVQRMAQEGTEVILGMKRDPHFGPLLMFGMGGIYVEVLKDVSFHLAPLEQNDAQAMIERIKSYPILQGVRGKRGADIAAVCEALQKISCLALDFPQIAEIDLNPLIVYEEGQGAAVVDARIVFAS